MPNQTTPFLELVLPEVRGPQTKDIWGFDYNNNFVILDQFLESVSLDGGVAYKATGGVVSRTHADRFGERANIHDHGAVGDGNEHPLSERYGIGAAGLAAAQVDYPSALDVAEQIDGNALRHALDYASSVKGNVEIPAGKYILTAGHAITPYSFGAQPDRWTAPSIVGEGRRQTTLVNQSNDYAFTYDLANPNHAWDGITVEDIRLTQAGNGGGFKFTEGTAQALFKRVEFNGMAAGARAISIETPGGIFDLDIGYCRFIGEDFPFLGQALFCDKLIINTHWHDNFLANVGTPGATSSIRDAVVLSCESSEFAGAHTVPNSNFDHTYWELAGFCFSLNFQNNYQEGTGGCFVRVGKDSTTINLDICNYNSYQYGQEVYWMVGTPSEMIFDGRNRAFNVHVDEILYKNHNLNRGGGYIFNDPWHDMDGEGVHRFWNIKGSTNTTSEPQAQRLVEQLLTGLDHTGAMVSVYNQDETWRRSGRGRFPTNPDQGVGNATNYTIFLPTDVPATRGAWAATTPYTYHDEASVGAEVYECRGSGISGVVPPTGTNPDVDVGDGVLLWRWLRTSGDPLKSQPGGYELNLTVGTPDFEHCLSARYEIIFDNRTTNDYTVCRAKPYDYQATKLGKPGASAIIGLWVADRSTYFGANLPLSKARAVTGAATGTTDFTILVNGASKGTIRFAAGATNATFIAAAPFSVQPGDYLAITAPAVADATLEDIAFNLAGELMHPKGGAAPRHIVVSVSNVGVVSVSAIQGGALTHRLWFSWKKLQGLS